MRDKNGRFIKGHKALGKPFKEGHKTSNTGRTWFKEKEKVCYSALHKWIRRVLGKPTKCSIDESHKSSIYYWANISGNYLRDIKDWRSLCPSCNGLDGVKIPQRFYVEGRII